MSNVTKKAKKEKIRSAMAILLGKLQILQEKVNEPPMKSQFNLLNRSILHRETYAQIWNLKKKINILDRKLRILEG